MNTGRGRYTFSTPMDTPPPPPAAAEARVAQAGLRLLVTDEEGLPIPGARVEVSGPSLLGGSREGSTDLEGQVRLVGFEPGTVNITIEKPGFEPRTWRKVELSAGRTTVLNAALPLSSFEELDGLLLYDLMPGEGRRGATAERALLDSLPWVSLGGTAGVLAHPALGTGEDVPARVLGLAMPDAAVGAVPRSLVDSLSTRSVAVQGPEQADLALVDRLRDPLQSELTLAGDASGALGTAGSVSGPLHRRWATGMGGVEAGLLGEAAGLSVRSRFSKHDGLWGLAAARSDAWLIGARGEARGRRRPLESDLSALVTGTEDGVLARVALDNRLEPPGYSALDLSTRVEGLGGAGRGAGLLSAAASLQGWHANLRSEGRVRVGAEDLPRLELGLGGNFSRFWFETFGHVGQRYEGLDAGTPDPVRSREALVGVAFRGRSSWYMVSALGAHRTASASGEPLPGRADLQASARSEFGVMELLASYTLRPAWDGFNDDLPSQEAGLLFGLPPVYGGPWSPTVGLGLQGALQEGVISGAGAARVGVAYRRPAWRGLLALEGTLDPDALRQVQLSLTVSPGP